MGYRRQQLAERRSMMLGRPGDRYRRITVAFYIKATNRATTADDFTRNGTVPYMGKHVMFAKTPITLLHSVDQ
ncbi:hypothetical protein DPMN_159716 [Dreissena polymorpha]|uniref:Uncharacterized protein n=1 Tax=Dreissena polymorpha TaxID=45954 RepID=A0A9D4EJJ5_DREPO|nr:hypothetical protein DPMN_159716 [Dreissena polymorpha]